MSKIDEFFLLEVVNKIVTIKEKGGRSVEIRELIDDFINSQRKSLKDRSLRNYESRLNVFEMFVNKRTIHIGVKAFLTGFNHENMRELMIDYKQNNNIEYEKTMQLYVSIVMSFFNYLLGEHIIENPNLGTVANKELFIAETNKYIKEMGLNEKNVTEPLEDNQIEELINKCNQVIKSSKTEIYKFQGKNNDPYELYLSSIAVKLTIFAGFKLETLYSLDWKSFKYENRIIIVNGYTLDLPYEINREMNELYDIQKNIVPVYAQDKYIFVNRQGESINTSSKLFKVLSFVVKGTCSSTMVAAYSMINMIQKGINSKMIMDVTGWKDDEFKFCQELVNANYSPNDRSRYMSSKLRGLTIFDKL